jgi:hypothetical protein
MASSNPFAVPPIGADAGVDKDRRGGGGGAQRAGGGAAPALNGGGVELVATAGPRAATSSPSFEAARALLVAAIPTKPPLAEGDVFLGEDEVRSPLSSPPPCTCAIRRLAPPARDPPAT